MFLINITSLIIKSSFSDYFPVRPIDCLSRYETPPANFYLADCYFKMVTHHASKGGIMCYEMVNVHLVVEFCVFDTCMSNSDGGAIFFSSTSGGIVVSKVCAIDCSIIASTIEGCFLYSTSGSNNKNSILFSTLSRCSSNSDNDRRSAVRLGNGNQTISNVNTTYCYNDYYSAYTLQTSIFLKVQYNQIEHCYPSGYTVIYIISGSGTILFSENNFINNSSPSTSYGLFRSTPSTTLITNCVFSINKGVLFSGALTCSNSFIQHSDSLTTGLSISLVNTKPLGETFEIINFGTALCITPIPNPTNIQPTVEGNELTPCRTIPLPPTPPQSLPLTPTECLIFSESVISELNFGKIIYLIHLIIFLI